jgi:hypothetical protein
MTPSGIEPATFQPVAQDLVVPITENICRAVSMDSFSFKKFGVIHSVGSACRFSDGPQFITSPAQLPSCL